MHFLVIGGNGRTGKLVIAEALRRGHTITALVRTPTSLEPTSGLIIVEGTPLEESDIRKACEATPHLPQAVLNTLSAPRVTDSPFSANMSPPRLLADSAANIITIMKEKHVRKIVIMQAFGVGDSWAEMHFLVRLLMKKSNMSYQYVDHNLVDEETRGSGIDYVLVRAARLVEGEAREVRDWGDRGEGIGMLGCVTRESVASWIVDAGEKETWNGRTPVLSN